MGWTPQQQAAISDRNRSVIVSAAAGSGKTAVLVARLLEILSDTENRVPAESIIVVTFTNDAAAQMKQRLYDALTDKMNQLDGDADEDAYVWLLRQQSALGDAKISTINAFCFNLIRENADICGVSSQFRIGEPAEEDVYVQHAMQTVLDRWNKTRPEEMETLFSFFCTRDDTELEGVILSVADYMKSLAFAEHWMERAVSLCKEGNTLFEHIRNAVCTALEEVLVLTERSRPYAEGIMPPGSANKFLDILNEDVTNIRFHLNFLRTMDMEHILENPTVHKVKFASFSTVRKNADEEMKEIYRQFREIYKKKYLDAVSTFLAPLGFFADDLEVQQRIIPLLLEVTQEYRSELFEEKRRRNVLCFDDGERLALSLLGSVNEDGVIVRTSLGEMLSKQYNLIMVDEYQDCNNKQDCLFKLLSRDCNHAQSGNGLRYGSNAFLVGDVKQSIYSFRQANPQNFMNALADSTPLAECRENDIARIYLNKNFRSSQGVIAFVNGLCSALMTMQCGEVQYDENEFLYYGASHYNGSSHTETTFLLTGENEPHEEKWDTQAECVAAHIAKMLAEKVPVTLRDGTARPCKPQDFCILLRSVSKDGDAFINALRDRGIPAIGEEKHDFFGRPEIRQIYNLLRILDNPLTDISMASIMLSPIYGFTTQDLVDLKLQSKRKRLYLQMREFLDQCHEIQPGSELLHQKCTQFMEQISQLRACVGSMSLEALVMHVYDETDLLSLQSLYEDAEYRRNNLQAFARLAKSYREHADLTGEGGIGSWLRYLDSIASKEMELGALPQSEDDCVAIKTIHKSKGLEYPFVFLAHLERGFSKAPKDALMHTNEEGLLGLRLINREKYYKTATAAYHYLLADIYRRQRSEEMRLFYVAMTRAQQQLMLVMDREDCLAYCRGVYKPKEGEDDRYLMAEILVHCPEAAQDLAAEASSMQEWILLYLLSCGEADHFIHALEHQEEISTHAAEYLICNAETAIQPEPELVISHASADADTLKTMEEQLAFRYQSGETELISKYSVTALSHPDNVFAEHLAMPLFLREPKDESVRSLRGAQRGTAVHKMLQYMDFAKAAENPGAELERLQAEGYLNDLEAETLSLEKLNAFFASELYQRIAEANAIEKEWQFFVEIGELALPAESPLYQKYLNTDGVLIGTMDLLFHEEDGWVLVDYKTDYVKTDQELLDSYSLQLGLYQKAAERIFGEPVKQAYIYSFTLDRAIEVNLETIEF